MLAPRSILALVCLILALLLAPACSSLDKALSGIDKPTATIQNAQIADISPRSLSLVFDVKISNPYHFDLPLADVDYTLAARDKQFLSGQTAVTGDVPASGSRVVHIPAVVVYNDLLAAVNGVKLGQVVPYKADLGFTINSSAAGQLHLPVSHSGELPIPNVPGVELAGIKWGNVSLQSADATVKLRVTNTNEFPVGLAALNYALQLEGQDVFDGKSAQPLSLKAGESGELDIPVSASASRAGLALLNMVRKAQASYSISGTTDLTTSFGPISLPFQHAGNAGMSR